MRRVGLGMLVWVAAAAGCRPPTEKVQMADESPMPPFGRAPGRLCWKCPTPQRRPRPPAQRHIEPPVEHVAPGESREAGIPRTGVNDGSTS